MTPRSASRRRLLGVFGALGAGAMGAFASARIFTESTDRHGPSADLCSTPSRFDTPLRVPRIDGLMGRLAVGDRPLLLRAAPHGRNGMLVYASSAGEREYLDPTLVVRTGTRVRVKLENRLDEPTIAHWHGLTIDAANDGNGDRLALPVLVWPGESVRIAIDFRLPFDGEQIYLFHCHNLEHEDGGMMLRVKVG